MLGENHSLVVEFPESKEEIDALIGFDKTFALDAKKYDNLDTQIRKLELRNSPIDDEAMHQLKHERLQLKDFLYQRILGARK